MKILQVIDKLDTGGSERVAVDLVILLSSQKNIEASFLCLLGPSVLDKELVAKGIPITYLHRQNKFNPLTVFKMLRVFNNYDMVQLHSRQVLRYVGLLFLIPFKKRFKLVFHDHYGKINTDTSFSKYLKFCLQNTQAYIGVSSSLTNWASENKLNNKVLLLPNSIKKQIDFKKLNNCGTIVVVGNFRPQKNYEFLCKLVSELPLDITIDLYAAISDKKYYHKISTLIKELKIEDRLHIILGKTNVSKLLPNYKLGLHCAFSETGPLVAIEYLSRGLPFLIYNTGEVVNVLKSNDYNLIMNTFEIEKWVHKIESIITNQQELVNLSTQAEKFYNANFSEKIYMDQCLSIYATIMEQN